MSAGPAITAIGLAMFARIGHSGDYLTEVLPAVVIYGLGLAITVAPLTSTVLAAVPASHAGMASAANNTIARASSLIAVAVLPAAAGLSGTAYLDPARFSAGFGRASLICAGLCLAGGVLAAITIRDPGPAAGPAAGQLMYCALDAPPARGHVQARLAGLAELPGLTMWASQGTARLGACHWLALPSDTRASNPWGAVAELLPWSRSFREPRR
jgi:hypothetical protein